MTSLKPPPHHFCVPSELMTHRNWDNKWLLLFQASKFEAWFVMQQQTDNKDLISRRWEIKVSHWSKDGRNYLLANVLILWERTDEKFSDKNHDSRSLLWWLVHRWLLSETSMLLSQDTTRNNIQVHSNTLLPTQRQRHWSPTERFLNDIVENASSLQNY